jgi:D-arabinose 1-dehydrogenase-like Zn-dependent alcohol dehydrogenase
VCGSDVHKITGQFIKHRDLNTRRKCSHSKGGWGEPILPICVGHEVIGRAVKVGPKCNTGVKVGDRVGVGAQVWADLTCNVCKADQEQCKRPACYSGAFADADIKAIS